MNGATLYDSRVICAFLDDRAQAGLSGWCRTLGDRDARGNGRRDRSMPHWR